MRHAWLPTVPEMGPAGGVVPKLAPWTVRKGRPLGGPFTGEMAVTGRVEGSGLRVEGLGFGVKGSGFRVQGSGFRVQGAGCRVQGVGVGRRGRRQSQEAPRRAAKFRVEV